MSKQVNIQIAQADLNILKSGNYALCVAKQVNDAYDVIWQATTRYLANNSFSWQPQYQVFVTNQFMPGMRVSIASAVNINLGQTVTLNSNSSLGNPSTGGPGNAITLVNNYGPIYPGVSQLSGLNGNESILPAYVTTHPTGIGSATTLTPVDAILVWFQQGVQSGTIFGFMPRDAINVNLANLNQATIQFQNGQWIQRQ